MTTPTLLWFWRTDSLKRCRFRGTFFLFQKRFAGTVNVAGTDSQNQITGLHIFTKELGYLRQGFAEHTAGNLLCQISRGNTHRIPLPGRIDFSQHQQVGLLQFPEEVIKQRMVRLYVWGWNATTTRL